MKQKDKKEPIIVYWSPFAYLDRTTHVNLLWGAPIRVPSILGSHPKEKSSSYLSCTAFTTFYKNCYALIQPFDSSITIEPSQLKDTLPNKAYIEGHHVWTVQHQALKDRARVTYGFNWVFFSEEPLDLLITPPYLHNTSADKGGALAAGSYDISRWFRPIDLAYILWEGSNEVKIKKGEPACYLHFLTDRPVKLVQFELTSDLFYIGEQCVELKSVMKYKSLSFLYDIFTRSNRHKAVLKIIKENLLDNV